MGEVSGYNEYELLYYVHCHDEVALDKLVDKFQRFIWKIIHSVIFDVHAYSFTEDDMYQEAVMAFYDAIERYRADFGVPFSAYVIPVVKNRILLLVRKHNSNGSRQLNTALPYDSPIDLKENLLLSEVIASEKKSYDPQAMAQYEDVVEMAKRLVNDLSVYEASVFKYRNAGYAYGAIAEMTSTTTKQVDNTLQKIRMKWYRKFDYD